MKEGVKGLVYNRGKCMLGYQYLVAMVVISENPIDGLENEMIFMGVNDYESPVTDAINRMKRYKTPRNMGVIGNGIVDVSKMDYRELEEIKPKAPKKRRKPSKPKHEVIEMHCGHCKKDTPHIFKDGGHERDSSGDYQECKECGWHKFGFQKEYEPLSID